MGGGSRKPLHEGPMGRKRQYTVLIVEDDTAVRLVEMNIVSRMGARALLASDGAEGLEMFRSNRPDLVLTDMHMPTMDGLQMVRRIMEIDPKARAMVVSGNLPQEDEIRLYDAGVLLVMQKPYRNEELMQALRHCLQGLE